MVTRTRTPAAPEARRPRAAPARFARTPKTTARDVLQDDASARAAATESATAPAQPPLAERVAEVIRQNIVRGDYAPGQRLSEAALAAGLGVSRNTLREVFRLLTQEGLLRHTPNRGVSVAVPGIAAIIDIYRVRRIIECQALAQAYPRHPARSRLRATLAAARAARAQGDWQAVGTANMAFHQAVVALADSERLNLMFARLLAELRLAFGLIHDPEYLYAPFVDLNARIVDSLDAGEQTRAARAMDDYLTHSERIVLAAYARRDGEQGSRHTGGGSGAMSRGT